MGGSGSGGKNRKPTAVKERDGNAGHRALNKREPKPKPGIPQIPVKLSASARVHWKRLVPILSEMKVLTVADADALGGYCTVLVQWELAAAAIEKYGILAVQLDEDTGVALLKVNPAVRVQSDALKNMRAFENEFGLTPASRSKLQVGKEAGPQDPLDAFLSGKDADVVH